MPRAALMSGLYQHRFGFEHNSGPEGYADPDFGLPLAVPTLAEKLKAATRPGGWASGTSVSPKGCVRTRTIAAKPYGGSRPRSSCPLPGSPGQMTGPITLRPCARAAVASLVSYVRKSRLARPRLNAVAR